MIFVCFVVTAIILSQGIFPIFWGDEYTTRHASRTRQVLCGSHLCSLVSLVAVPLNLAVILGTWLDPFVREMVPVESIPIVGIIVVGAILFEFNLVFYYLYVLSDRSFKNVFCKETPPPIIETFEKTHKIEENVLTDYIESMFFAIQKNNTTAE
ncbi:MAG: hypothetical protein DRO73_09800 [Candidatus Thorarchaeota archaeon]|nr:MAG: hypothetical protein DRO73_09800 [Candidatus Thorarchaeota archaeon]